jgi:hypothetical protein
VHEALRNALVDTFVATADQQEVRPLGQLRNVHLLQGLPARRKQYDMCVLRGQIIGCGEDRLGTHDHASAPAVRLIVDRSMLAESPTPQVVSGDLDLACLPRPTQKAGLQRDLEDLGKESENVDPHG